MVAQTICDAMEERQGKVNRLPREVNARARPDRGEGMGGDTTRGTATYPDVVAA